MRKSKILNNILRKTEERRKRIRRGLELRRLRRIRKKKTPSYKNCKNCGTELKGMYCHHCGQYALDVEQPFWKYVLQYFENVYQFDGKVWVTLWMLFRRPGFLTAEFNAGKIASYVHPMRLLMFITVIFFLAFFVFIEGKVEDVMGNREVQLFGNDMTHEQVDAILNPDRDSCVAILTDSSLFASYSGILEVKECRKGSVPGRDTSLVMMPSELVSVLDGSVVGTWSGAPLIEIGAGHNVRDTEILFKERVIGTASGYAPMVALLLTPVMGLLLMWFYRKFRMGYMAHFVFSLHLASFFYIILSLYIAVGEIWQYTGFPWYVFCTVMLLYTVIASHRVYSGTGWPKAALKAVLLLFVYGIVVSLVVGGLSVWLIYSQSRLLDDVANAL